ncbi:MAG: hypothetical protein IH991_10000, partial [Planctomycetes bacterium]|nr:hypothetical protein [Planctomycetota bacterium]
MYKKAVGFHLLLAFVGSCMAIAVWMDSAAGVQENGGEPKSIRSQKDDPNAKFVNFQQAQPMFLGAVFCQGCHNGTIPLPNDFSLLDEFVVWEKKDKHSQAFTNLSGDLGKQMAAKLGYDVTADQKCLSCHCNWIKDFPKPLFHNQGVSCESCHGPAQMWSGKHAIGDPKIWRNLTPDEKKEDGFVDVRNPVDRARQCFNCHIGNAPEGKIVTHEMYAAGHPPLPGVEVESFVHQMPKHWRYLREKGNFATRDKYIEATIPGFKPDL